MITLITVTREQAKIKELLKDEAKVVGQIETDALASICLEIDVPFELSAKEEVTHIARVLCHRGNYKEVPITSKEKIMIVGNFTEAGEAVYLAKRK